MKAVVLTEKGEWMRIEIERRAGEPPPKLAALSDEDATALRDILARALATAKPASARAAARRRSAPSGGSAGPRASARGCAPTSRPCART